MYETQTNIETEKPIIHGVKTDAGKSNFCQYKCLFFMFTHVVLQVGMEHLGPLFNLKWWTIVVVCIYFNLFSSVPSI